MYLSGRSHFTLKFKVYIVFCTKLDKEKDTKKNHVQNLLPIEPVGGLQ